MTPDIVLLLAAVIIGLVTIPLGLPGIWLMLLAGVAHRLLVVPATISWVMLAKNKA